MKLESPSETVKILRNEGCTVEQYEKVQSRRKERLAFWNKIGVKALIKNEQQLVELGEEVLKLMRKS